MDIRRVALWEGRNATYMSNDIFSVIIEDWGEVLIELSSKALSGAKINAMSLPYFRGTGVGVDSDENALWWHNREAIYAAGGGYFTFPTASGSGMFNSTDNRWELLRYGMESDSKAVWKLSELMSRNFIVEKIDMLIPYSPVLYTSINIQNKSGAEINAMASWHTMLGFPAISPGTIIQSNARLWTAYGLSPKEKGSSRFESGKVFDELRKAPLKSGGIADAGYIPPPTGTYDYLIGKIPEKDKYGWVSVNNPPCQTMFFMMTSREGDDYRFPNVDLAENYFGRADTPWALFDGATPEVMALTVGFNTGPRGTNNFTLPAGGSETIYIANGFVSYENPRLALGAYSTEIHPGEVIFKRTKSWARLEIDTSFKEIRKLSKRLIGSRD